MKYRGVGVSWCSGVVVLWCRGMEHHPLLRFFLFSLFILFSTTLTNAQTSDEITTEKYKTWVTLPPYQQLYTEGLDDQKGMGRIFVPTMTSSTNEPFYAVFQDEELIGERTMGSSYFLPPGKYTVRLGTGTMDQRIRRDVDINRGQTIILEPNWCAITIDVIDESRNNFKKDLQIYNNETFENFGIIPAINPELGEQLQTLILAPGLYKIVERGGDPNTFVNFATVLLEAGKYIPYTVVVSSQTSNFIGSGILTSATRLVQTKNWKLFGAIHGSAVLNSSNVTERNAKTDFTFLTQLENRVLFDKLPHYYLSNNLIEIGALRPEDQEFQINQDRVQLKNTYVYYFLPMLGGYGRFEITTHLFPTIKRFDSKTNIILRDLKGNDTFKENVDEVKLENSFFPMRLEEGFGMNVTALRTFSARLNFRTGFGFRQTYNRFVYRQEENVDTLYTLYVRKPDEFEPGYEASLISSLSIFRNLTFTTEADIFFPIGELNKPKIDLENTTTLAATRNVSIDHIYRLTYDPNEDWTIHEQLVTIRLSYFLF